MFLPSTETYKRVLMITWVLLGHLLLIGALLHTQHAHRQPLPMLATQVTLLPAEKPVSEPQPVIVNFKPTSLTINFPAPSLDFVAETTVASPRQNLPEVQPIAEITPPKADSALAANPPPHYPAVSRQLMEQGQVVLSLYILEDGTLGDMRLKESSGFRRLDEAAMAAVKQWRFSSATKNGVAVAAWYEQSIVFSLSAMNAQISGR